MAADVTSFVPETPAVCVTSGVDVPDAVTVVRADGTCVVSVGVVVAKVDDPGCSVVCVLGAALVTVPVAVTGLFAVNTTDDVNGAISVRMPVTVGTFASVIGLLAWIAGVTIPPVETVTDVVVVPDKVDAAVTTAVPVRLLFVAVSSAVAAVLVTTAVTVGTGVADAIATGVLSGSTLLSVADKVAAAVSTAEIASPTLPIAAVAGVPVGCSVIVNAGVGVSIEFALGVGPGVAAVGRAAVTVPVTALVLLATVGRLIDDVLEVLAAPVNAGVTLMPWADVIKPVSVTG